LKVFFLRKPAQNCRGLPLGSSSITAAVALVDRDMLTCVWDEMDYRIDVCHIIKSEHTEHLSKYLKKKKLGEIICISV
jgi:hypothetical protein